jgi:WD40 repeat protein
VTASAEPTQHSPREPYVGLNAYREQDADFFFGRDREIDLVVGNLQVSRLTLFYGESGVGKSSILRAGAMHALRTEIAAHLAEARAAGENGDAPEKPPLAVAYFRGPWAGPLPGLMAAIHAAVEEASAHSVQPWTPGEDPVEAIRSWTKHVRTILVVLDQVEEYFLYHPSEEGRDTVAGLLTAAVNDVDLRVNFLLSIREDGLAKLDRFKKRIPIFGNVLRIEFLDDDAAKDAIEKPLERYGELAANGNGAYGAEPELVEEIIRQARKPHATPGGAGGAAADTEAEAAGIKTPVLQLILQRLWEEEKSLDSPVLRLETFRDRLRGAENIFRAHLEGTMAQLTEREKDVAAASFRQLVTPSGTKIAQTATDLAGYAKATRDEADAMLSKLVDGRILDTVPPAPGRDERRFEIVHDSLGPTLLTWSNAHAEQRAREEGERKAEERARKARRRALILAGGGILTLVALAIVGLLVYMTVQQGRDADRAEAEAAREREEANAARAEDLFVVDPHRAMGLALASLERLRTDGAERVLRAALSQSRLRYVHRGDAALSRVAVSPKGGWIISTGEGGVAQLFNPESGAQFALEGHENAVLAAAFNSQGTRAVTAGEDQVGRVWEAETGRLVALLEGHSDLIIAAVFSPTEPVVATASYDGTARIWNAGTGGVRAVLRGHESALTALAVSPRGDWIATADEGGGVRLWRRPAGGWHSTGKSTHVLAGTAEHVDWVNALSFSRDGRLLVSASDDKSAVIWNVRTGKQVQDLRDHPRGVLDAAFSPDGAMLATVSEKTLRLWGVKDGFQYQRIPASTDWVYDVEFRPSGSLVMTSGADGVVRLWEAGAGGLLFELRGHTDGVERASFTPDGRSVVTASADGTTRVWDATTGIELRRGDDWVHDGEFGPRDEYLYTVSASSYLVKWDTASGSAPWRARDEGLEALNGVAVGPDGTWLVSGGDDGIPVVWDAETGTAIVNLLPAGDEAGHGQPVVAVDADPRGGNRIATASVDETAIIWTWSEDGAEILRRLDADPDKEGIVTHADGVFAVTYSSDGERLMTAGGDHSARVWDADTGRVLTELRGHDGSIGGVAFHPSGELVATASEDRSVRIWRARDGRQVRELGGLGGPLRAVSFSRDGRLLAAGGSAGQTFVWEWPSGRPVGTFRMHADLINSVAFAADGRILTTSDDHTARLYRCTTCGPLEEVIALARRRLAAVG